MAALDLASLTSLAEGFPNVVAEAMASEVPCVVTDVGDARWIVGETGRLVPGRDPAALAAAWSEMLALTANERRETGARARTDSAGAASHNAPALTEVATEVTDETAVSTNNPRPPITPESEPDSCRARAGAREP